MGWRGRVKARQLSLDIPSPHPSPHLRELKFWVQGDSRLRVKPKNCEESLCPILVLEPREKNCLARRPHHSGSCSSRVQCSVLCLEESKDSWASSGGEWLPGIPEFLYTPRSWVERTCWWGCCAEGQADTNTLVGGWVMGVNEIMECRCLWYQLQLRGSQTTRPELWILR